MNERLAEARDDRWSLAPHPVPVTPPRSLVLDRSLTGGSVFAPPRVRRDARSGDPSSLRWRPLGRRFP